jgi:peptidoglycan/LPS O-acetylase OafA/YrhL
VPDTIADRTTHPTVPSSGGPGPRATGPGARAVLRERAVRWTALDGLRGVAVAAVVGYHVAPERVRGGFLGVDMFFVLSGFLITAGLLRERDRSGRTELLWFWRRRARRLWAPLLSVLVVATALAGVLMSAPPAGLRDQWWGVLGYVANWQQIGAQSSYFANADPPLFQHLWSLGVEEQFYLVWPLLVIALHRVGRHGAVTVGAGLLASASVVAMVLLHRVGDPSRAYLGTDTHSFGLLIGAVVAVWVTRRSTLAPTRQRAGPSAWLLLVTLLAAMALMDGTATYPYLGGIAAFSVGVGLLVGRVTTARGMLPVLLSAGPLVWLGRRSYAIYLWHWPFVVIAGDVLAGHTDIVRGTVVVSITLLVAELSWWLLERPIRERGLRGYVAMVRRWVTPTAYRPQGGPGSRLGLATTTLVALTAVVTLATSPGTSTTEQLIRDGQSRIARAAAASHVPDASASSGAAAGRPADAPAAAGSDPEGARRGTASTDGEAAATPDERTRDGRRGSETTPSTTASSTDGSGARTPSGRSRTQPPTAPRGRAISAVGDSVMLAAAPALLDRYPGMIIEAEVGEQMSSVGGDLARLAGRGQLRDRVVIGLGTNGDFDSGVLERAVRTYGQDRQFYLVNAHAARSWTASVNAKLGAVAARHGNVHLVDWSAASSAVTDFAEDGIHPGSQGGRIYTRTLARVLSDTRG